MGWTWKRKGLQQVDFAWDAVRKSSGIGMGENVRYGPQEYVYACLMMYSVLLFN